MPRKPKETEPAPEAQIVNVVMFGTILSLSDEDVCVTIPNREARIFPRTLFADVEPLQHDMAVQITLDDYNAAQPWTEAPDDSGTGHDPDALPETFTFKADVANVFRDTYEITVTGEGGATATLSFEKDALDYEGKGVHELEAGYCGLTFTTSYALAEEKHLVEMLGQTAAASESTAVADESESEGDAGAAPYKKKLREETITVTVVLDPEEREACGQRMADAIERKEDLEDDLDTYRKSVNAQIKEVEKEISEAARLWRRGKEEREISCDVVADYNTGELVWCEKAYPHKEVKRQRMTEKDRHLPLPLGEAPERRENAEAEAGAEEKTITLNGRVVGITEDYITIAFTDNEGNEMEFEISRSDVTCADDLQPGEEADFTMSMSFAIDEGVIDSPESVTPESEAERSCGTCFYHYRPANEGEDDPCFDCGNDSALPNWRAEEEETEEA